MSREESSVLIYNFLSCEKLSLLNYSKTVENVGYRAVYDAGGRVFCMYVEKPIVYGDINRII